VIAWGSYDESKPRVRLLLNELEKCGVLSARISIPIWNSVRDKSVEGWGRILKLLLTLIASYPAALIKLAGQRAGGALLLAYPAIPDIFAAWPIARLRGHKIILDAFISLHDTVVTDRAMVGPNSLTARLIWGVEWLALHLADIILVDTDQHGDFFAKQFGIARDRFQTILVGAEPEFWNVRTSKRAKPPIASRLPTVLFYGQLIPLHGLDAIIDAIRLTEREPIHWLLIGSGQEEPKLQRFLDPYLNDKVTWLPWIDYTELPAAIADASIALGIFGTSDKAGRVIPNKAFQILAAGRPLITRSSPAMARLAKRYPNSIKTVPPGDGRALAEAIRGVLNSSIRFHPFPLMARFELDPAEGVRSLVARLPASTAFSNLPQD